MPCLICGSTDATETSIDVTGWQYDCPRCGRYRVNKSRENICVPDDKQAVASHLVRKLQTDDVTYFPELTEEFFASLKDRSLPSPAEMMDNFVLWMASEVEGRPGKNIDAQFRDPSLIGEIGAIDEAEIEWAIQQLQNSNIIIGKNYPSAMGRFFGKLTASGWRRCEQLQRDDKNSRYAFFARRFENAELDNVFKNCLKQAVKDTGYELRTVTQKAGLIDAIIEDEIRRCKFLIADLTDHNNGAYWEAGFAEGLGKPVIYICKEDVVTHFDTSHRHTIRWGKKPFDETAKELKAVIRNTLLGDAKQSDD
jgi:hypothetical protein